MEQRLIAAVHSREVRGPLFLALDGLDAIEIVGVATSAAELASQCRSLRPDIVIVEAGLSHKPLEEVLDDIALVMWSGEILVIGSDDHAPTVDRYENVELMTGVDQLPAAVGSSEPGSPGHAGLG